MRIRYASAIMRKRSVGVHRTAVINHRPTGATVCTRAAATLCPTRAHYAGKLKTRSNTTPESRTKAAPASNRLTI